MKPMPTEQERFWAKVHKEPGEKGCWLWTGAVYDGIAMFHRTRGGEGKRQVRANHYAYEITGGIILLGDMIISRCQGSLCIKPDHGDVLREGYKQCTQCGEVKPVAEFPIGQRRCKRCTAGYLKAYVSAHKELLITKRKEYRAANLEIVRAREKANWVKHRAANLARNKVWREANKETLTAKEKRYRQANKEKIAVRVKTYREANRETLLAKTKAWQVANKEKVALQKKAYVEANRETITARAKRYREAHKEKIAAWFKAYREANKKKLAAWNKAWRIANKETLTTKKNVYLEANKKVVFLRRKRYRELYKETIAARKKAHYVTNREVIAVQKKRYHVTHKETINTKMKAYYLRHKETLRSKAKVYRQSAIGKAVKKVDGHKRRIRARFAFDTLATKVDFLPWMERGAVCYLTGTYLLPKEVTIEHVVPLHWGGTHDAWNILPSSFAANILKKNRLVYFDLATREPRYTLDPCPGGATWPRIPLTQPTMDEMEAMVNAWKARRQQKEERYAA